MLVYRRLKLCFNKLFCSESKKKKKKKLRAELAMSIQGRRRRAGVCGADGDKGGRQEIWY